ncbi:hypothetical protein GA0061093_13535 [Rhodococcus qingshengii]|nr:hypothetical protein GA0061093_13535 [Rhodococcus qingshengii]
MLDARYVLCADEIPDDLWAVIEPVLLPPLAGRRVLPWNDHRLPLEDISRGVGVKPRSGGEVGMRAVRRNTRGW